MLDPVHTPFSARVYSDKRLEHAGLAPRTYRSSPLWAWLSVLGREGGTCHALLSVSSNEGRWICTGESLLQFKIQHRAGAAGDAALGKNPGCHLNADNLGVQIGALGEQRGDLGDLNF